MARFLFLTIQQFESDFYGDVGRALEELGHEAAHVTVSRRSTRRLRRRGCTAYCLLDELGPPPADLAAAVERIESDYPVDLRDAIRTDTASAGVPAGDATRRAVRWFEALESLVERIEPDVVVPEVGAELPRTLVHSIALGRSVPTLFLFYTIFPNPLRLYVDAMHAPIVPAEEVRPLDPSERQETRTFVDEFTRRAQSIRPHRRVGVTRRRLENAVAYLSARAWEDRDNEYLHPGRWARDHVVELLRRARARGYYERVPATRFVYFPLHVVDDYKITRLVPHLRDQLGIVRAIAEALPDGLELVVKEHPLSVGRNALSLLRALRDTPRVRLVDPHVGSHELIRRADAVAVISSTVGLEALLYEKPVLTVGRPFYSGYGVTLDIDSPDELSGAIPRLVEFEPATERIEELLHACMRACLPGAPVLVDRSRENADRLARSLSDVIVERRPSVVTTQT